MVGQQFSKRDYIMYGNSLAGEKEKTGDGDKFLRNIFTCVNGKKNQNWNHFFSC